MKKVVKGIDKNAMKMAYVEMGEINLQISREDYLLENEGEGFIYELGTQKTEAISEGYGFCN